MALKEVGCGGMDWFELAQNKERWWAPVPAGMKFQFPYIFGELLDKPKNR